MKFPDNNIQTSPVTCNKISNAQWIVDFTGYVYDPNIDDALQCLKNWYNKDNLYLKITHAFIDIPQVYGIEKYIDSSSVPNHYLITVKESYENKPCEEYVIGMYHTKERKLDAFALPEKGTHTSSHTRTSLEVTIRNPDGSLANLGDNSYVYFTTK